MGMQWYLISGKLFSGGVKNHKEDEKTLQVEKKTTKSGQSVVEINVDINLDIVLTAPPAQPTSRQKCGVVNLVASFPIASLLLASLLSGHLENVMLGPFALKRSCFIHLELA